MEADIGCLSTCRWLLVVATFGIPSKLNIDYIKQVTRGCMIRSENSWHLLNHQLLFFAEYTLSQCLIVAGTYINIKYTQNLITTASINWELGLFACAKFVKDVQTD